MGASCSSFRLLCAVLIKLFHVSWNASSDSAICTRILILACSWCRILHELSNFWWHFLTEKLPVLTNQIAPLLSICGWTELGKMFGIDYRWFLFSPFPPPPCSSLPTSPHFLLTQGLLARSLVQYWRLEQERKGLLQFSKKCLLFGFVKQVLIFVKNQCTLIDGTLKTDM